MTTVTVHCQPQDEHKIRDAIKAAIPDVTSTETIVDMSTGARITFDTAHPHAVAEVTLVKLAGARVVIHD